MEYVSSLDIVKNQTIKIDREGMINSQSQSKIIRISLLTPKLGGLVKDINQLNKSELVWTSEAKEIKNDNYTFEVVYKNDVLKPWMLIKKNNSFENKINPIIVKKYFQKITNHKATSLRTRNCFL